MIIFSILTYWLFTAIVMTSAIRKLSPRESRIITALLAPLTFPITLGIVIGIIMSNDEEE